MMQISNYSWTVLEVSYDTRGNRYKLVPKLCKYELRKQFFVNRVVKLWNMLPTRWYQLAVSVVLRDTEIGFGVTGIYVIIITKPTCSTGSHNVIIVLVKFLL